MRIPLTRYGLPQVIIYPLIVIVLMLVLFLLFRAMPWLIPAEIILFLVFLWMLSFFRDPLRNIKIDDSLLLSPADGVVTDISYVEDSGNLSGSDGLQSTTLRIGIFLSVFNVHINRFPCAVRVEKISYKKGAFKNAMSAESGKINESNDILMVRLGKPEDKILVRQISGAIARHIVCEAKEASRYRQGEAFGMIKFGSRTELYLPAAREENFEVTVKIGDKVRAGLTPLVRYLK